MTALTAQDGMEIFSAYLSALQIDNEKRRDGAFVYFQDKVSNFEHILLTYRVGFNDDDEGKLMSATVGTLLSAPEGTDRNTLLNACNEINLVNSFLRAAVQPDGQVMMGYEFLISENSTAKNWLECAVMFVSRSKDAFFSLVKSIISK